MIQNDSKTIFGCYCIFSLHCPAFCVILCFCDETLINLDFSGETKMTAKAVNYTPEQTTKMVADYANGVTVEAIATELGKSVRSIVAKLSREKVYKAKTYKTKTGEAVIKKDEFADSIAQALGLTEADADSLTKANKTALKAIADFIAAEKQ
jgi:response regulator RpfG family c-di-GMP phosphodiesterase